MSGLQSLGLSPEQALAAIDRSVSVEASMLAIRDYFAWSIPLFLALLVQIWMAKPVRVGGGMPGGRTLTVASPRPLADGG